MDLLKTLLVYMMVVLSSATESNPAVTPIPPTVTPTPTAVVTQLPTQEPTATATLAPTATPSATPTAYDTLSKGSKGDDVRKLQRRLQELGYYNGSIDGDFGNQTKKAVERFQTYNDLKVDGIAGRATQTMLYESTAVVTAPPEITQGPTATPKITQAPITVNVPVYYVDQDGKVLHETAMTIYGTATIYAQSNLVPEEYALLGPGSVKVTVENGAATPASVAFRYQAPAQTPTAEPTSEPTAEPTVEPTAEPTAEPTVEPTTDPTDEPTAEPTTDPTDEPTNEPTDEPTAEPTTDPTDEPTDEPTAEPTNEPTDEPTVEPTTEPTDEPTAEPTNEPTDEPTAEPTTDPTDEPTAEPTTEPTDEPTAEPTNEPTDEPSAEPTEEPTTEPTDEPTLPPEPLQQAGTLLGVNGADHSIPWYRNEQNMAFVELKALADAALVPCDAPEGMLSMTLNGYNLAAQFTQNTLNHFLVDGQELTDEALQPVIWNGKLYVSDALLIQLGVTCTDGGTILAIENVAP